MQQRTSGQSGALPTDILEQIDGLNKSQKSFKRLSLSLFILLSSIVVATLFIGISSHISLSNPIPNDISSQVDFPLYYPTELPSGFSLDKSSFRVSKKIVTYIINYDNDKTLIVNVQDKPANFDFESFQSKGKKLDSSLGDAYVGALGNQTVASIVTTKSWLLIGIPSPIDTASLVVILQHLRVAK